jgi:hypothetical protein
MGQDEINLMSDAAHQEWLDLNAEVVRLNDEVARYKFVHESDERALKAIAESADRYAEENERLRKALNPVQKFYNAYMEQLAKPYMMDIPVLQEVEELRKLLEAEAAIIKKV